MRFGIAPSTVPRGVLSQAADIVLELNKMVVKHEKHRVIMFSELARYPGKRGID